MGSQAHSHVSQMLGLPAAPPDTLCVYYRSSRSEFDLLRPFMSCIGTAVTPLCLISSTECVATLSLSTKVTELPSKDPQMFSNDCKGWFRLLRSLKNQVVFLKSFLVPIASYLGW